MDDGAGRGRRWLGLALGALALVGLAALLLASRGAQATNDPPPSGGTVTGDWTVTDNRAYYDVTITLAGNLTVENGGTLKLVDVLLVMDARTPGQYGIEVRAGGKVVMQYGTITTTSAAFCFRVRPDGALNITDGQMGSCGYAWGSNGETAGLFIESDNCNLTGATIEAGYYGVVVRGASPILDGCYFEHNLQGCVVIDSAASFTDCVFAWNRNGDNFENWSGNMSGCTFAYNSGFGLLAYGSDGNVTNCNFVANSAGNCVLVGSDAVLSNCTFRDSLYGIYLDGSAPRVSDCSVTGNRYGAYLYKSAPSFTGCKIWKSSLFGMSCLYSRPTLVECTISETGYSPRDGFYWGRGLNLFASNATFAGGRLSQNYYGVEARYSTLSFSELEFLDNSVGLYALGTGAYLAGCNFSKNLQIGAHLTESCTGAFERCTFTCMTQGAALDYGTSTAMGNSTFRYCREGLRLFDCDPGAAVTGCTFENNSIGATLTGSASRVLSCSFASNVNYSLSCSKGSAEIRNCSFRDCPTNALTLDGCGGVIDGNRFDKVEAAGIFARNSTSEISNNTFSSGRGTAIHSVGTSGAPNIHDNLFFKNGLGVALSDGSSGRVHHNDFSSNQQAGIALREARGEIFCNTVSGSVYGISCILLSDPSIHDNEVFENEGGILCEDSSNATVSGNRVHGNSRFGILARMSYPSLSGNIVWGNLDGVVVAGCPGPAAVTLFGDSLFNNTNGLSGLYSRVEMEGCNFTKNLMSGALLVNCISTVRHGSFSQNRDGLRPEGGTILVAQCDFLFNNQTGIITDSTEARIDGCYFYENTDGALDLGNSTIRFEDGVFENNRATGFYCQWSTKASWTIGRTARAQNDWFAVRGNITVRGGGSLRLGNCTLSMMLSGPGDSDISVQNGGRLEMLQGSRLQSADPDNKYSFRLLSGGNLTIEESTLQDCGGGWGVGGEHAGLVLLGSDCQLREVRFQNCSFGLVADGITADFEYLTFLGCDYAVIAMSSVLRLDNSTVIQSGTMDFQLRQGSTLTVVNTSFDRGKVSLLDQNCILEVYWYLGINVVWQNRAVVEGARLTLVDSAQTSLEGGFTDERGWLLWVPVLEFRQSSASTDARNPYVISVSKAGVTVEKGLSFQNSLDQNFTLYDLVLPVIRADQPAQGAIFNLSMVEAGGMASDAETGLWLVEWSSDGQSWQPANGTGQWSFLASFPDGSCSLLVRAADAAGNRAVLGINFTVKTRMSVPVLYGPAEGLLTRHPEVAVNGTAETGATVQINGVEVPVVSGNFSASVSLVEGNNTILVTAADKAGNTATITRRVVLDTTPPAIELWSPRNGSYTNIRETTVSGRTEPGARVWVNGGVLINTGGRFSVAVSLGNDSDTINITVMDPAGNVNSTGVSVNVDLDPPSLVIISPKAGRHTQARTVTITGTTEPYSTVTAWDRSATAGSDGSFTMNLTILYGNNTLIIKSTDRAGNVNSVTWSAVRDRPPEEPGPPWITALAAVAATIAAENGVIYIYRRRREGAAPAPAGTSTGPKTLPGPAASESAADAAVPEASAEPVPPEALPVGDDEEVEMLDMK